ncbi:hypothetical protein D3C80_1628470 [compost metagenome]
MSCISLTLLFMELSNTPGSLCSNSTGLRPWYSRKLEVVIALAANVSEDLMIFPCMDFEVRARFVKSFMGKY